MTKHIFKIIWNERKANAWIVLEYVLVFCILWFCCDYLYYIAKCYYEPLGFDITNTYAIGMSEKELDDTETGVRELNEEDKYMYALTMIERLQQHPDIEAVALSSSSVPYSGSSSSTGFQIDSDSIYHSIRVRHVSSGFFDVFRIKLVNGSIFDWTNPADQQQVVISSDREGYFGDQMKEKHKISDVKVIKYGEDDIFYTQGYTEKLKGTFFDPYESTAFHPLKKSYVDLLSSEISIRVRPNTTKDFEKQFIKEMNEFLSIGPYRFSYISSLKDMRKNAARWSGITENMKSILAITSFLIINIFLGIIGTFWYRTESRKSEIGLRIALGASRKRIRLLLCTETFLLLLVSSIIGVNIIINIAQTDILNALGIPQADPVQIGSGIEQYFINFGITFLFLLAVSLIAVWYPAKQSSDMHPADALHEE
ncbi:MAG: ABC transporter permease [Tannerella sp.]|jgi:putative ABC transport system permease protein|nr:ABC transporter permease [Tannerella sp.]